MKFDALGKFVCLTGVALAGSFSIPALSQNPPATTYHPGYWQPITRVNPSVPLTITLVNQTPMPLKYNFLDEHGEKSLPARSTTSLTRVKLPINIAIYNPAANAAAGEEGGLTYQTSVTNNNNLQVVITPDPNPGGDRVIDINRTGAVYYY